MVEGGECLVRQAQELALHGAASVRGDTVFRSGHRLNKESGDGNEEPGMYIDIKRILQAANKFDQ